MTSKRSTSVHRLVLAIWQDRWWIAAAIVLAGAASVAYALTRQPLYQSDALLAPAKAENSQLGSLSAVAGQLAGLGGLMGLGGMQSTDVEEAVAVLRSRQFTDNFLRKHEMAPALFPELWDPVAKRWVQGKAPPDEDVFKRFDQLRDIIEDRRTNYVRLAVRARTAQFAHDWAVTMISDLNETMRTSALEEAHLSVQALAKKMQSEQVESVRVTAATLLESQLQREILAEVRKEFALRVLDAPTTPEQRMYPRRTRMVLIGVVLGGMLGCLFALGRRAWASLKGGF